MVRMSVESVEGGSVHDGPVVLVARRPDLVAGGTRVCLSALLNLLAVGDADDFASGVSRCMDGSSFAIARTALCASG